MKFVTGKIVNQFTTVGKKVILRYPKMSDVDGLLEYINSLIEEEARIMLTEKQTRKSELAWLKRIMSDNKSGKSINLIIESEGKIIGSGGIDKRLAAPHSVQHVAEIRFGIKKEYRRLGVTYELAKTLIELAKKQWNIEIVRSSYASDNLASAKLHEKLGFKPTGVIPKGMKYGNKYTDEIIAVKKL